MSVALVRGRRPVATWVLAHPPHPGLDTVDRLARWQLDARRGGYELRLLHPSPRLLELVRLAGLADVLGVSRDGAAGRRPEREAR